MPLYVGGYTMQVAFPVIKQVGSKNDWMASALAYPDIWTIALEYDTDSGATNFAEILGDLQNINAANPIWLRCCNDEGAIPQQLFNGVNVLAVDKPVRIQFNLTSEQHEVSREWMPTDYGHYGVMRGNSYGDISPMWFITDTNCEIEFFGAAFNELEITLLKDVVGQCTVYPYAGVPPILYNVADSGWLAWSGDWQWFGPSPL